MFAELLALLFAPLVWLLRPFIGRKRASPEMVRAFYKTPEWKRLRYTHLSRSPACVLCGRSAKDGTRMNVDHIRPLHAHWNLRLAPHNLQTLCATCNHGKGGTDKDWRSKLPH
ncbi:MAG: HNH endonuclease [Acidobacteriota bacterium]|nr:HNH endonuclease [Acidobacteriota bacterium]